jgi:predicted  nucleic acid-binding Zn-ribbon protein
MEELKIDIKNAVKNEYDEEQKKLNGLKSDVAVNKDLISKMIGEQKQVTRVQRSEIDKMEACISSCQISIAQHDERLKAYEDNAKRQNGVLDKLNDTIDDVGRGISTITKKVDAMHVSITNRIAEVERTTIAREAEYAGSTIDRIALRKEQVDKDIEALRVEIYTKEKADNAAHAESQKLFYWKLIGAVSAIAFLFLLIIFTLLTGTFGSLP